MSMPVDAKASGTTLNDAGAAGAESGAAEAEAHALPNPFRERVDVGFNLPIAGLVRVEVFDVQGRCVRAEPPRLRRRLQAPAVTRRT